MLDSATSGATRAAPAFTRSQRCRAVAVPSVVVEEKDMGAGPLTLRPLSPDHACRRQAGAVATLRVRTHGPDTGPRLLLKSEDSFPVSVAPHHRSTPSPPCPFLDAIVHRLRPHRARRTGRVRRGCPPNRQQRHVPVPGAQQPGQHPGAYLPIARSIPARMRAARARIS
jgi:hypothetical protein